MEVKILTFNILAELLGKIMDKKGVESKVLLRIFNRKTNEK